MFLIKLQVKTNVEKHEIMLNICVNRPYMHNICQKHAPSQTVHTKSSFDSVVVYSLSVSEEWKTLLVTLFEDGI